MTLHQELQALGAIGFEAGVGTSRVAYSDAYFQGRDYVRRLMEDAGLETRVDAVGNLFGVLPGASDKAILIGSHIDSVPGGGIYDGALGVLAGIHCLQALRRSGYRNRHTLEVAAFIDEEGNAIGGTFGSRCFSGQPIGAQEQQQMRQFGLTPEDVRRAACDPGRYRCYLELHIEQGGQLERAGAAIGIVEGIVGILRYHAVVHGQMNHAGSTPMALRDDALEKACRIILRLMDRVREADDAMVCTVGKLSIPDGAVNVIPGQVLFPIELRHKNIPDMQAVIEALRQTYGPKELELRPFLEECETILDAEIAQLAEGICRERRLPFLRMFSGAGHDAIHTARIMPAAILFLPSVGGISHSIREFSRPEEIDVGVSVFEALIKQLDGRDPP